MNKLMTILALLTALTAAGSTFAAEGDTHLKVLDCTAQDFRKGEILKMGIYVDAKTGTDYSSGQPFNGIIVIEMMSPQSGDMRSTAHPRTLTAEGGLIHTKLYPGSILQLPAVRFSSVDSLTALVVSGNEVAKHDCVNALPGELRSN